MLGKTRPNYITCLPINKSFVPRLELLTGIGLINPVALRPFFQITVKNELRYKFSDALSFNLEHRWIPSYASHSFVLMLSLNLGFDWIIKPDVEQSLPEEK